MEQEEIEAIIGAKIVAVKEETSGPDIEIILNNGKKICFFHCEADAGLYVKDV